MTQKETENRKNQNGKRQIASKVIYLQATETNIQKKVCIFEQKPSLVHETRIMFDHSNTRLKETPLTSIQGGNIWTRKSGFRCVASEVYVLEYHTFLKRSETDSKMVPTAIHNAPNMLLG